MCITSPCWNINFVNVQLIFKIHKIGNENRNRNAKANGNQQLYQKESKSNCRQSETEFSSEILKLIFKTNTVKSLPL